MSDDFDKQADRLTYRIEAIEGRLRDGATTFSDLRRDVQEIREHLIELVGRSGQNGRMGRLSTTVSDLQGAQRILAGDVIRLKRNLAVWAAAGAGGATGIVEALRVLRSVVGG